MARKKTYLYRIAPKDKTGEEGNTIYLWARNADVAEEFCGEQFPEYAAFEVSKIGISHYLRETSVVSEKDAANIRIRDYMPGAPRHERDEVIA